MTLCECGCGQEINPGKRFIYGHSLRIYRIERGNTKPKHKVKCHNCGKIFEIQPSRLKRKKYCSRICADKGIEALWQTPEYRTNQMIKKRSKVYIEKARQAARRGWMDKSKVEKRIRAILKGSAIRPNKSEIKLDSILQSTLPNEYRLNVKGEILIGRSIPDFVNINGQKKIVELFGEYWHPESDEQKRIKLFKKYGYTTLIVWESELNKVKKLEEKLIKFNLV